MDFTRLTQGEKIAGVSGIALILIMFIFKWFGLEGRRASGFTGEGSRNAWGSYGFIDIVLFITVVAAVGLAADQRLGEPRWASRSPRARSSPAWAPLGRPDHHQHHQPAGLRRRLSGTGVDHTRKIGVWLGLIAAIGVAYGGWRAMQEEGTSFGDEADRFRGAPDEGPGAGPPPPPSSAASAAERGPVGRSFGTRASREERLTATAA